MKIVQSGDIKAQEKKLQEIEKERLYEPREETFTEPHKRGGGDFKKQQ